MTDAKTVSEKICSKRKKDRIAGEPNCKATRSDYQQKKEVYQTLKRQQLDDLKADIKAARERQKEASAQ